MARLLVYVDFLILFLIYNAALVSAVPQSYTTYLVPEHRNGLTPPKTIEELSLNNYELQIVPKDQYILAEHSSPKDLSLFDISIPIPSPIVALVNIASKALSVGTWLLSNSGFIVLGAALLFGFCAFTPFCTITIEAPLTRQIRALNHYVPYLDDVECFFRQAYQKYEYYIK